MHRFLRVVITSCLLVSLSVQAEAATGMSDCNERAQHIAKATRRTFTETSQLCVFEFDNLAPHSEPHTTLKIAIATKQQTRSCPKGCVRLPSQEPPYRCETIQKGTVTIATGGASSVRTLSLCKAAWGFRKR